MSATIEIPAPEVGAVFERCDRSCEVLEVTSATVRVRITTPTASAEETWTRYEYGQRYRRAVAIGPLSYHRPKGTAAE
jgi:hypothetical protein